jgi:hypothetical protein
MPTDLASEIFGRLRQLNDEQRAKDFEQQNQLVKLYSGFADQVEPDSMGAYLQGFEKLMFPSNMTPKGFDKKGFMNAVRAFSGMPSEDFGTRLGTEFRNLTSKFMGPQRAQRARFGLAQALTPRNEFERVGNQAAREDIKRLPESIVLRDPQQEAIEKLKTQYGIQYQNKMNEIAVREENLRERQEKARGEKHLFDFERDQWRSTMKATGDIREEAFKVAGLGGRRYPTDDDYDQAVTNIARRDNLNEDVLRARAGYLRSRGKEAERNLVTGKPSDVRAERQFSQNQYEKVRGIYDKWFQAREKAKSKIPLIKAAESSLGGMVSAIGGKFDPQTRSFVMPEDLQPSRRASAALQDYLKILDEEAALKAEMLSSYQQLKGMPEYVGKIGQSEWEDIDILPGIAPSAGIRRQGPQKPTGPQTRMGKGLISIPYTAIPGYQFDQIGKRVVTWKGNSYLIIGENPDGSLIGKLQK